MTDARLGRRVLLVEDDALIRRAIVRALRNKGYEVEAVASVADALVRPFAAFHVLVIDVRLPDGSGVLVAEAATKARPRPHIIAITGAATPPEAFKLAQLGVARFLVKPFAMRELVAIIEAESGGPELEPVIAAYVGTTGLHTVIETSRRAMVREALELAKGNRTEAGRILGVSRQAVQKFLRAIPTGGRSGRRRPK